MDTHRRFRGMVFTIVIIILFARTGYAEPATDKTLSPYFLIESGDPAVDRFPLKNTDVSVPISGVIADVTVLQTYTNDGMRPISARYIFPASTRAAVHGMQMTIGENVITARIKEKEKAETTFAAAKKQGKSAALLKQQRPNVFSMNVANIMPGDTLDIELHYTELLIPTDGTYQFVYPTVVGPRYSEQPESTAPASERWVQNPYLPQGSRPVSGFNLRARISTGIPLAALVCRSHDIETSWESESVADITFKHPENSGADRDYILEYRLAGKQIQSGPMLYEGAQENFFLLMVQPPERIKPKDIPDREYIFVVDVSGSMDGFPLNTAKDLLSNLIAHLRPTDKFNVIFFAGGSRVMAPTSLPATPRHVAQALRLLDHQRGGGSTRLQAALQKALALPRDEASARSVVIVTDGYISAEKEVFQLIRRNLNRTNVFAFGIGSSVNRYLVEGIAKAGLGEPFIATDPQSARSAAGQFREYIQAPLLTGITVKYTGFDAYDVEPAAIGDLFAHRPVIIQGKWRGAATGAIEVSGTGGSGKYGQTFHLAATQPREANRALRPLWARSQIARLADFNFNDRTGEEQAAITSLGLTYSLLTDYTAFVAVQETVRNAEGHSDPVAQPLNLPTGVSNLAVSGGCANVPEPELAFLLIGLLLYMATRVIFRRHRFNTDYGRKDHASNQ